MKQFPDESQMKRSEDGSEPIRGGSIGLNRVLNTLVVASNGDKRPRFTSVLVNAFTIFDNVYDMESFPNMTNVEEGFIKDINLFLEYLDTYFSHVLNHQMPKKKYCSVIVYFPDYHRVAKEIQRPHSGKNALKFDMYHIFRNRHQHERGLVRTLDHVHCFFTQVGHATYPHRELVQTFREIATRGDSLYSTGDPVGIFTHIPLDLYIMYRLRNVHLIERHTGRIRPSSEFHLKLDKQGRVPLQPEVHLVVGDDKIIRSIVEQKIKKKVLAAAEEERWSTRSREDVAGRVANLTGLTKAQLRQHDFT